MHLDHDHIGAHSHEEAHTHEHTHADGTTHTHEHAHPHDHTHDCGHSCESCGTPCEHTPMKELAELAKKLEENGNHTAYEQVMAAVSDFEKGNMRLSVVLSSLAE